MEGIYIMAHFAELDSDNIVINVLVFSNEDIDKHGGDLSIDAEQWVSNTLHTTPEKSITGKPGIKWIQTSYNGNFRKQFAGRLFKYDSVNDVFIRPSPFPQWILDNNFNWQPPIPLPENLYIDENELVLSWDPEAGTWEGFLSDNTKYLWNQNNLTWEVVNG